MAGIDETLSVQVPTHLFKFEEKVMGLTISQLMFDTFAAAGIYSLWNMDLPLNMRLVLCGGSIILVILLVHVKIRTRSLVEWGTLFALFWLTPSETIWYSAALPTALEARKQKGPERPSVQATWINLESIENSYMVFRDDKSKKGKQAPPSRYSVVLEVTGINIRLLSLPELLRIFRTYEAFLAGLEFPLQIITCNETVDIQSYEPLLALEARLGLLKSTPCLAALAQNHLQFLRKRLGTSIVTRHYVIVSASPLEREVKRVDGKPAGGLALVFSALGSKKQRPFSSEETIRQLRIRYKVVRDGFRDMGLQTHLLDNSELAHFYAMSLAPGTVMARGEWGAENLCSMALVPFPVQKTSSAG